MKFRDQMTLTFNIHLCSSSTAKLTNYVRDNSPTSKTSFSLTVSMSLLLAFSFCATVCRHVVAVDLVSVLALVHTTFVVSFRPCTKHTYMYLGTGQNNDKSKCLKFRITPIKGPCYILMFHQQSHLIMFITSMKNLRRIDH